MWESIAKAMELTERDPLGMLTRIPVALIVLAFVVLGAVLLVGGLLWMVHHAGEVLRAIDEERN